MSLHATLSLGHTNTLTSEDIPYQCYYTGYATPRHLAVSHLEVFIILILSFYGQQEFAVCMINGDDPHHRRYSKIRLEESCAVSSVITL
jgi:hypothetical protein